MLFKVKSQQRDSEALLRLRSISESSSVSADRYWLHTSATDFQRLISEDLPKEASQEFSGSNLSCCYRYLA
jgi:hypothetical protein